MKLYDAWIKEHSRSPRFQPPLAEFTHKARCNNPLCGDRVDITVQIEDGKLAALGMKARACAITKASASLMSLLVTGQPLAALPALAERAKAAVDADEPAPTDRDEMAPLVVVRTAPSRRRCATLPWEALLEAVAMERS
ncbi:MAG: iron-sulfur cluster assembly scaffold protein [Myxococcota bacterium]